MTSNARRAGLAHPNVRRLSLVAATIALGVLDSGCSKSGSDNAGTGADQSGGATGGHTQVSSGGRAGTPEGEPGGSATGGRSAPNSGGTEESGGSPGRGGESPSTGGTSTGGEPSETGGVSSDTGGASAAGAPAGGDSAGGEPARTGGAGTGGGAAGTGGAPPDLPRFSFFVTSHEGLLLLSGSQDGFGGDLRYGEADGLSGADRICAELAEISMTGAGAKGWRAFLSASSGPGGQPIHAIDRIGAGPWYDRTGRTVALSPEDLLFTRPRNADAGIVNDLPNEFGVPNHAPDGAELDNHHIMTGTNDEGHYDGSGTTCEDWTSVDSNINGPTVGFSWPGPGGDNWMTGFQERGCAPGAHFSTGEGDPGTVGTAGGYGGIYCFALNP